MCILRRDIGTVTIVKHIQINRVVIPLLSIILCQNASASNSSSSQADGFGGFVALISIGFLAFMAPRMRRESLEEIK